MDACSTFAGVIKLVVHLNMSPSVVRGDKFVLIGMVA